jgi:hypothetical protein
MMEFPAAMFKGKFASQEALELAWREGLHTIVQITVKSQDEAGARALEGFVLTPQEMIEKAPEAVAPKKKNGDSGL